MTITLESIILAASKRMQDSGITVEINKHYGNVVISCKGYSDLFMFGDSYNNFMAEVFQFDQECPEVSMEDIELAVAAPYVESIWN